tara:strand:+ start:91 stop:669 length:579 start_codon:yes stop_codon:yes gene_type:complete
MGLKQDLIDAKIKALEESGANVELDTKPGSMIEREAEYTKDAIVNFLTKCEFTITKLNAPMRLEKLKTPPQAVDVKLDTLLADKAPILKSLKSIGKKIPGAGTVINKLVDQLEGDIKRAIAPILEGGAKLQALKLGKNPLKIGKSGGGLDSTGYVYIGQDPESEGGFNVDDTEGQSQFTKVKLLRENIEDLL